MLRCATSSSQATAATFYFFTQPTSQVFTIARQGQLDPPIWVNFRKRNSKRPFELSAGQLKTKFLVR